MGDSSKCVLPVSDRKERTMDFRALFATGLLDRQKSPGVVQWMLRAGPGVEVESRRLAKLEERCCDGIVFAVRAAGDRVLWQISGPPFGRHYTRRLIRAATTCPHRRGC